MSKIKLSNGKPVYKIFFSEKDNKYVVVSSLIPGIQALGETPAEALKTLLRLSSSQENQKKGK